MHTKVSGHCFLPTRISLPANMSVSARVPAVAASFVGQVTFQGVIETVALLAGAAVRVTTPVLGSKLVIATSTSSTVAEISQTGRAPADIVNSVVEPSPVNSSASCSVPPKAHLSR